MKPQRQFTEAAAGKHKPRARSFFRDQRGVVAISFAITFLFSLAGTLFAVDMVRHNTAQARVQNALDTAIISAGRKLSEFKPGKGAEPGKSWEDDAYAYFSANMPAGYLGSVVPRNSVKITYSEERVGDKGQYLAAQNIQMEAKGNLPLLSTGFIEMTSWPLGATNYAVRRVRNDMELVLALDNTGSMEYCAKGTSTTACAGKSTSRMSMLKDSATQLIETVMGAAAVAGQDDADGPSGAYIGLVPFTDSVNVGGVPAAKNWLEYPADLENYISQVWAEGAEFNSKLLWSGCIVEPGPAGGGNWTSSNRLPAAALTPAARFRPLLSTYSFNFTPSKLSGNANKNNFLVKDTRFAEGFAFNPPSGNNTDRRVLARVNGNWGASSTTSFTVNLAQESQYCTRSRIQFLTKNEAKLKKAIKDMESYGGTGVPTGLLWAWRMLSPAWEGAAGWGEAGMPRPVDPKLRKVIVLLSDGDNAPVVRRSSDSVAKKDLFRMSYSYGFNEEVCARTELVCTTDRKGKQTCSNQCVYENRVQVTQVNNEAYSSSLSSFAQCPINGLRTVNPADMTPSNYTNACGTTPAQSSIGYDVKKDNSNTGLLGGGYLTEASLDSYMTQLCTNVKKDSANILVYTLTLGSDVTAAAKTVMRSCASSPDAYFDVTDGSKLPEVFAEIAGALTELRLTPPPDKKGT